MAARLGIGTRRIRTADGGVAKLLPHCNAAPAANPNEMKGAGLNAAGGVPRSPARGIGWRRYQRLERPSTSKAAGSHAFQVMGERGREDVGSPRRWAPGAASARGPGAPTGPDLECRIGPGLMSRTWEGARLGRRQSSAQRAEEKGAAELVVGGAGGGPRLLPNCASCEPECNRTASGVRPRCPASTAPNRPSRGRQGRWGATAAPKSRTPLFWHRSGNTPAHRAGSHVVPRWLGCACRVLPYRR